MTISSDPEHPSVSEVATLLGVTPGSVRRWIRAGTLVAVDDGGIVRVPFSQEPILERLRRGVISRSYAPYTPSALRTYSRWHDTLDNLAWLLKTAYGTKEEIKARRFRLDKLFASYITSNRINASAVRQALLTSGSRQWRVVMDDLRRGWYNELAFCTPIRPSTLGLSFHDIQVNMAASGTRFAFPSWPIIEAYYAVYFFLRSICLLKLPDIRLEEHNAAIRTFNNNVFGSVDGVLWCFPLNLVYAPNLGPVAIGGLKERWPHWRFKFARHPRTPHLDPAQCVRRVGGELRRRARRRRRDAKYGLFDLLREFRVWANYQDIDSMLKLWGGGYRAFLDMNLSTLLFFVAGIAELAFISTRGGRAYVKQAQSLYDLVTENNPTLLADFRATSVFQRYQVYLQLGIVRDELRLKPQQDPHAVHVTSNHGLQATAPMTTMRRRS